MQLYLNVGQINLYNESLPVSLTLFLGKTRKVVDETVVTTYALRLCILKQLFSRLAEVVYNRSNILSSEVWFPCSAILTPWSLDIFKFSWGKIPHKVTSADSCLKGLILSYNRFYHSSKICALFWLAQRPTGTYHIWMMRVIYHRFDGTFLWKRGWSMVHLIGNEAAWEIDHRSNSLPRAADWLLFTSELKNGVHGYPKMK